MSHLPQISDDGASFPMNEVDISEHEGGFSDAESATSTVVYDQEPFESFCVRVQDLVKDLWKESFVDDINITRLTGGGYNRIIGISKKHPSEQKSVEYILRVPRFDAAKLDRDVAILRFVRSLGGIPVPQVVAFDATANNKLEDRYMIQARLSGTDLLYASPVLDHSEKCVVAAELGHIIYQMFAHKSDVAGLIDVPPTTSNAVSNSFGITISAFFEGGDSSNKESILTSSAYQMLENTFQARKAHCVELDPKDTLGPETMNQFIKMASELDADGWFEGIHPSLCHLDFEPRNILVNVVRAESEPMVTGMLDWDSAVFAPSFMSCRPPLWIWAWADDEDEDKRTANDAPPTTEGQELKVIFEKAAGPAYLRYAYTPAYRLARQLVRFAIDGVGSNEHYYEAKSMLREWANTRDSLREIQ